MNKKIFIACDTNKNSIAQKIIKNTQTNNLKIGYKFGLEFLNSKSGRNFISKIKNKIIFADLKINDIPNTCIATLKSLNDLKLNYITIHISSGLEALKAVKKSSGKTKIVGVTTLTSLNDKSLKEVGLGLNTEDQVLLLAELCQTEGLNGVVCSANELSVLRKHLEEDFLLVTPGIRSSGQESDDQKRISTASEAISNGADYIVIGREISNEIDPSEKIRQILETV